MEMYKKGFPEEPTQRTLHFGQSYDKLQPVSPALQQSRSPVQDVKFISEAIRKQSKIRWMVGRPGNRKFDPN